MNVIVSATGIETPARIAVVLATMMTTIGEESGLAVGTGIASGIVTHGREEAVRVVDEAMIMTGIGEDVRGVAATTGAGTIAANGMIDRRNATVESAPT